MARQVLVFIALVAFAGIAWGQPCNSGVCKLDVTVEAAGCANAANIKVSPDPLPVPKNSPNRIEWTIQTNGYTFVAAPNGITSLPSTQPSTFKRVPITNSPITLGFTDMNIIAAMIGADITPLTTAAQYNALMG